jgi:hypothetical protein
MQLSEAEKEELLRSLLEKQGTWVEWGKACQKLQKAGVNPQEIFEQSGFQGSQQNLIIVAAQVYESLVKANATEALLQYYRGPRSDILYELRILNQEQRLKAAIIAQEKKLDLDGTKEVARAIQQFSRLSQPPAGFTFHPGDAVAYQYWKSARQKKKLEERARLIAQGLKFAHSQPARTQIEQLLTDFTVTSPRTAPLLPIYRLEAEEELPRIVPLVGTLPLTKQDLESVAPLELEEPFRVLEVTNTATVVALPGWQAVLKAQEPVAILSQSERLPQSISGKSELLLVLVDRSIRQWDVNSYFVVEREGELEFQWFEESPDVPLLGQVILVLRPKKILDENNIIEPWQMDD